LLNYVLFSFDVIVLHEAVLLSVHANDFQPQASLLKILSF